MSSNLTLYAPKSKDDIEEIKQKYISWVKSSNTISDKFKRQIDDCYVSVTRVWKSYHSIDCNRIVVSANASEFSSTTYHVDAKITGNKIYSDGKYDYYRKEDFTPAHDETGWDISTQYRKITLSKEEGDDFHLHCGEYPNGPTEYACNQYDIADIKEISQYVDSTSAIQIREILNKFDVRKDCVGSIIDDVEKKYKSVYSGTFKFTVIVESIHDIEEINSQYTIIFPVYEIKVNYKMKKYGGIVYSLDSAVFNAPQYAPQSHDHPYRNYQISIILSVVTLLALVSAMILSPALSHKGLMQMYWLPMIFMALFDGVFIMLLFKQMQKKRANYVSAQEKRQRSSVKWLITTIMISIIMCATTAFLCSLTDDEDFFYTPEIVGHYVDQSGDYSEFEMTVQSCDNDGNLVVLHSFNERHKTYNVVYSGKISKKTLTKTVVELKIVEYEKLPMNYSADSVIVIEFDNNFNSIKYDYITMTRTQE